MPEMKSDSIKVIDFGLQNYGETLSIQKQLFQNLVDSKKEGKIGQEYLLIGEHPDVITLGRRANEGNVLISESTLREKGVEIYHISRGGDVTFHCPGQIIMYPIIDLERHGLGVKDYVEKLEESVIRLLNLYDVKGERIEGATGVWVKNKGQVERKISAIGVKCSRYCTMHGLSLNVTNSVTGFSMINPCGFTDKGITTLAHEIKNHHSILEEGEVEAINLDIKKVKQELSDIFFSLIFPFKEVFHLPE